jgi:D-alanyl-D-alanine carboxypeptidase
MDAASGISAVLGRITEIGVRFGSEPGGQFVVAQGAAFDPFGSQYQAAVSALQAPARATSDAFSQSYAPPSPYGAVASPSGPSGVGAATAGTYTSGFVPPPPSPASGAQIQAAIDGTAAARGERPVGGYGSVAVPSALMVQGNGQIPTNQLSPVGQGGHKLWGPAAASWQNLVSAAAADGISIRITDSYRSYEEQVDLAERKGLYKNGGLAAVPGTSPHGWGMAVDADVRDAATLQWLKVNGPRFGWVETTPREPWHWEFRPSQV